MKKKISVIVTTYNSQDTIKRTLDSLINQEGTSSVFDLELIIVDDCSTDSTARIVEDYEAVLLTTGENSGGPNKGRNIGLDYATGDYICIVDHDDEWYLNRIMEVLPYLELAPIVTTGYTVVNEKDGERLPRFKDINVSHILYQNNETFLSKLKRERNGQNVYLGSIIYSSKFKEIKFEEHFGMVDFDWILRLFNNQKSIEVTQTLYDRYVFGQNLSLNENYRQKDYYYSLLFIERYKNEYPKEVRWGSKKINGSRARYYYLIGDMRSAREYFLKSRLNFITLLYMATTFFGSKFVKKKFNIFG